MKLLTMPNNIEEIRSTIDNIDGIIIGINGFSVNTNLNIDIDNLSSIIDIIGDKKIFIMLNKNMHNDELNNLKNIMDKLNHFNISGVMYADVGVLNIYKKANYRYPLLITSEHSTTNYETINFWINHGVSGVFISNDITALDIDKICSNVKELKMTILFGYLPMFVSRRHIVKNYLDQFKLTDNSKVNFMYKEDKVYPIIDNKEATFVYNCNILNGIDEYVKFDHKLDYAVINSFLFDINTVQSIISIFRDTNLENLDENKSKLNSMFQNIDRAFLDTGTIYRVKKNEK